MKGADLLPPSVRLTKRALAAWFSGEPELHVLRRLCAPDEWALDVGANCGIYSWHLRRWSAGVVAFEPQPLLAGFVRSALGARVRVEEVALSDRDGEAVLRVPILRMEDGLASIQGENPLTSLRSTEIRVPRRRLDAVLAEGPAGRPGRVGVVKIDVEGHELAVLAGAEALLARDRPSLLVEAEERHRPGAFRSVARFLEPFGYRPRLAREGRLYPLNLAAEGLSGNFVFVARPALLHCASGA